MRMLLSWALSLLTLISAAGRASADVGLSVNSYLSYTDNLFQNYSRRGDLVALTYFDLDRGLGHSFNLYYSGNANVFAEYQDLFTHTHRVGLGYGRAGRGRNAYYSGLAASLRLDRSAYRYYDYVQGDGYLNAKVYLGPSVLSRVGYDVRYRHYTNAGDYSYLDQAAYVQLNRFLPTCTTLQAQAEFGWKYYLNAWEPDTTGALARAGGARNLTQLRLKVKVAQALASRTGLQVAYSRSLNLAGRDRYSRMDGYNADDELFDDAYSRQESEWLLRLKCPGPAGVRLALTGQNEHGRYEGRPALDLDGVTIGQGVTRSDHRRSISVEMERGFRLKRGRLREIGLRIEGRYLDVASNDQYYDTSARTLSAGLQVLF